MDTERWPQLAAAFSAFRRPVVIIDLEATGGNPPTEHPRIRQQPDRHRR